MNKLIIYIIGLVILTSSVLADWTTTSTQSTLTIDGEEIVTVINPFIPYWDFNGGVFENVYQVYGTEAHFGSVIISDQNVWGTSINGLTMGGQHGTYLSYNGMNRLEVPNANIVKATQSDWGWYYDNDQKIFFDAETGNIQTDGSIQTDGMILFNGLLSSINNPLWLMASDHNAVIIGNNAENPLAIHEDDKSTFKNKVILEEVNNKKGKPLCLTAEGEIVICATTCATTSLTK